MKKILFILLFTSQFIYSQSDYFDGAYTFCPIPDSKEARDNFKLGLDCIKANKYIGGANRIFLDLIKKDSTFCDAYFLAGYTYRLSNMDKPALIYYAMADSLSKNKSLIFKQNAAFMAVRLGAFKFARKKYEQMTQFFADSPEGYYGIAATAVFLGDTKKGLQNLDIAMEKYNQHGLALGDEIYLTQGILYTKDNQYDRSIEIFEKLSGRITKNDDFRIHYAYSLLSLGKSTSNEKMIQKAHKIYHKIEDKSNLSEALVAAFK